ncbi:putative nucleoredoxin 1 [Fagus crenata]
MGNTHPSHPEHKLKPKNYKKPYTCDGCKEHGIGKRYRCEPCNYDLHKACMFTSTTPTKSHDLFGKSTFKFYEQHPGKSNNRKIYCNACGKRVKGFVYHCPKTDKNLHPCCSNLEDKLEIERVKFRLRKTESKCSWCDQIKDGLSKIKGWSYVSECGKHNIHVYCFMEMRVERWKDGTANDNDCSALKNLDLRSIQGHLNRNLGRGKKYMRIGKIFLKTIILLGDPTIGLATVLLELLL